MALGLGPVDSNARVPPAQSWLRAGHLAITEAWRKSHWRKSSPTVWIQLPGIYHINIGHQCFDLSPGFRNYQGASSFLNYTDSENDAWLAGIHWALSRFHHGAQGCLAESRVWRPNMWRTKMRWFGIPVPVSSRRI